MFLFSTILYTKSIFKVLSNNNNNNVHQNKYLLKQNTIQILFQFLILN